MLLIFAAVVAAFQTSANSASPEAAATLGPYHKWKIGRSDGYKEKKISDYAWKVGAQASYPGSKRDLAVLTTLYRSAIITKSAGYTHFFPTKMEIGNWSRDFGRTITYQEVSSTIYLHNAGDPLPKCEAKPKYAANCRDTSADEVIAEIGPILGQSAEALQSEIHATKNEYYTER